VHEAGCEMGDFCKNEKYIKRSEKEVIMADFHLYGSVYGNAIFMELGFFIYLYLNNKW
jgi:hypothetical protein